MAPAVGPPLLPAVVRPGRAGLDVPWAASLTTDQGNVTEGSRKRRHDPPPGLTDA